MANAKRCDRCGAFYMPKEVNTDRKTTFEIRKFDLEEAPELLDLCDKCLDSVQEFMQADEGTTQES